MIKNIVVILLLFGVSISTSGDCFAQKHNGYNPDNSHYSYMGKPSKSF